MFKLTEIWALDLFYDASPEFHSPFVKVEMKKQAFSAHPTKYPHKRETDLKNCFNNLYSENLCIL